MRLPASRSKVARTKHDLSWHAFVCRCMSAAGSFWALPDSFPRPPQQARRRSLRSCTRCAPRRPILSRRSDRIMFTQLPVALSPVWEARRAWFEPVQVLRWRIPCICPPCRRGGARDRGRFDACGIAPSIGEQHKVVQKGTGDAVLCWSWQRLSALPLSVPQRCHCRSH